VSQPAELLEFFKYQNQLKVVLRTNRTSDNRRESSAEHSWSVAMMTWTLADIVATEMETQLDQTKMLKMALIHDLVEIEAGDVAAWKAEDRQAVSKHEVEAIEHIAVRYIPDQTSEMRQLWLEHEARQSLESKVVKACDQLCPLIYRLVFDNSYMNTGVTRQILDDLFLPIVSFSKVTTELYQLLADELDAKHLFDVPA
jgi:putative hydrolase of HD superfamily